MQCRAFDFYVRIREVKVHATSYKNYDTDFKVFYHDTNESRNMLPINNFTD